MRECAWQKQCGQPTDAVVRVDGREERCADAVVIILPVRDMRASAWVTVFLREPEVDDVHA